MPRFARPALILAASLAASGCAGLSFAPSCGPGSVDPMTDGASRLNPAFHRHAAVAQHQAYQQKAMMLGTRFSQGVRKPGSPPPVAAFCMR